MFLPVYLLTLTWIIVGDGFIRGIQARRNSYYAKKYDPDDFIIISAAKPLGISLVENDREAPLGVCIDKIYDGPVKQDNRARKGLHLIAVNDIDTRRSSFDTVMDTLAQAEGTIKLTFIDPRKVSRGSAVLNVIEGMGDSQNSISIAALKGQNLRAVLLERGVQVYSGKAKVTNCGGGGSCGTCAVLVTDNEYWEERPDFERLRLKKYPDTARLSCNTIIEGDCTVQVQPQPPSRM